MAHHSTASSCVLAAKWYLLSNSYFVSDTHALERTALCTYADEIDYTYIIFVCLVGRIL